MALKFLACNCGLNTIHVEGKTKGWVDLEAEGPVRVPEISME